mgnify:FL=1
MKIILSAIIGNEAPVIERFIRSFAPAVDEFVFVIATGNQEPDHTREIILKTCLDIGADYGISTYENAHDFPHVDSFGAARNEALRLSELNAEDSDYIIWADADDTLADGAAEAIRTAAEDGKHDVYIMPYNVRGDKQVVWRERMVKAGLGSKWRHAIHEQLHFPNDVTYRMIKDAVFQHLPLEDKQGGHERNLAILQGELKETPRSLFYLAQEYFQSGKLYEFKPIAEAALILPGLTNIEEYELLMQLAQSPGTEAKKLAAEAFALMPDRREALALLVNYAIIDSNPERALELSEAMMALDTPKRTYWSLNHEWYGWKGDELYRQCLRLNGEEESANNDWQSSVNDDMPTFSVVHATDGQPEKALAVRETWLSFAAHPENVDYVFVIDESDTRSLNVLKGFRHTLTRSPDLLGEVTMPANDATFPAQGWDKEARDKYQPEPERELQAV